MVKETDFKGKEEREKKWLFQGLLEGVAYCYKHNGNVWILWANDLNWGRFDSNLLQDMNTDLPSILWVDFFRIDFKHWRCVSWVCYRALVYLKKKSVCPRSSAEHFAFAHCSTEILGESQHSVKAIRTEASSFKSFCFLTLISGLGCVVFFLI